MAVTGVVAVFVVLVGQGPAVLADSDLDGYQRAVLAALFGASLILWALAFIVRRRQGAGTAAERPAAPRSDGEPRPSDGQDAHTDRDPLDWEPPPPPWARG